jgi:hypothetical protein
MKIYFYPLTLVHDFGFHTFDDGFEIALIWWNLLIDWSENGKIKYKKSRRKIR